MLHSLGGGLMACGVAILAITHYAIRKGERWAVWTVLIIAFIAQGFNGYGMYAAGSHYWYPILLLSIVALGTLLNLMKKEEN
jgi:hypothetical protein